MNIDTFRSGFDGVRANRYRVVPGDLSSLGTNAELYVKALSIPGSQIGMIPVSFQGRQIKFAGERQFGEWAITVYDSAQDNGRKSFESWMDKLDGASEHGQSYNVAEEWRVFYNDAANQGHPEGSLGGSNGFRLVHCWPVDISPIDLSYDMVDSFAEFTVTIAYDYHLPL